MVEERQKRRSFFLYESRFERTLIDKEGDLEYIIFSFR